MPETECPHPQFFETKIGSERRAEYLQLPASEKSNSDTSRNVGGKSINQGIHITSDCQTQPPFCTSLASFGYVDAG